MVTGIDWYEYQIKEKEKELARHKALREVYRGKDCGVDIDQMIYNDEHYLIMLRYSLQSYMWYRDDREDGIGWCADK